MESNPFIVSEAPASDRVAFFKRTYLHVAGAFAAFGALLYYFFQGFKFEVVGRSLEVGTGVAASVTRGLFSLMDSTGGFGILIVMVMFWGGTYVAQKLAENRASRQSQYLGLGLYVVLEALIFIPLIVMVGLKTHGNPSEVLVPACAVTAALVVGLTVAVFTMGIDFSFLRVAIVIGSFCALGVILVSIFTNSDLGNWFSIIMILLMATVILYQTQVIKDSCETDQHVLAAFILFSAFVTLLFYVIRLFAGRRD
jgi:FtsH-binding integral membrane protein